MFVFVFGALSPGSEKPCLLFLLLAIFDVLRFVETKHTAVGRDAGVASVLVKCVHSVFSLKLGAPSSIERSDGWKVILLFWEVEHILVLEINHVLVGIVLGLLASACLFLDTLFAFEGSSISVLDMVVCA